MDNPRDMNAHGPFEARYLAFLETIANLRPSLHRYCSRMTGPVLDGELGVGTNRKHTIIARYRRRKNPKHLAGSQHLRADGRWRGSQPAIGPGGLRPCDRVPGGANG